jgi:surface polysaccharide O-acyltransferase-like enzyme
MIAVQVQGFDYGKIFGFILYFILGYYLKVNPVKKDNCKWLFILGTVAIVSNPIITAIVSCLKQQKIDYMENYQSIIVFIVAVSVFTFFTRIKMHNIVIEKWIAYLSPASFGIYLIHILVMNVLVRFGIYSLGVPAILVIPLVAVLTFSCSFLIMFVIKQIPFISKYVM